MVHSMLYLGLSRGDGQVSDEEFARFAEAEIATRWKEGYAILDGQDLWYYVPGQAAQPGRVLVRFHDGSEQASADIEAVRTAYRAAFNQDAVPRADRMGCESFLRRARPWEGRQ